MAERRMFSKRIAESARFLMMPPSTQALYFHLGLNADDDGVVEAFPVLRMLQCSEDDLRILSAKNFVQVLNDDLVTYISDWNINNKLRADRKIDSLYKNLLLQINPDVKLLEPKQRADRKKGTSQGQPMDCIGEDSIGKDSTVQYREVEIETPPHPQNNYSKIAYEYWKETNMYYSDNEISFLTDFKLGLETVRCMHSDDVLQAIKNYTSVLKDDKVFHGYKNKTKFSNWVKNIERYLPKYFDIKDFQSWGKEEEKKKPDFKKMLEDAGVYEE